MLFIIPSSTVNFSPLLFLLSVCLSPTNDYTYLKHLPHHRNVFVCECVGISVSAFACMSSLPLLLHVDGTREIYDSSGTRYWTGLWHVGKTARRWRLTPASQTNPKPDIREVKLWVKRSLRHFFFLSPKGCTSLQRVSYFLCVWPLTKVT